VAFLLASVAMVSLVAAIYINAARRDAEQNVVELQQREALAREQVNVAQFNRAYVTGDLVIGRRVIDDLRQDGHRLDEFEWRLLKEKLRSHVGAIDRPGTNEAVISLVYAPDGRALVAGTDKGNLFTWNARTLEPLGVTKAHDVCVNSIHLSPDGEMAATTSCDKLVKLWNTKSWECVGELVGHTHEVGACAFSPDGKLLVSGTCQQDNQRVPAGEFRLWDVATRECLSEWRCELNAVFGMSFISDRAVVACFRDGEILQWDISTRPPQSTEVSFDTPTLLQRPEIAERSFAKNTLIPSADRRYLAFFDGFGEAWSPTWNKLILVDLGSGETRKLAEGRYERAIGAFSPDSRLLAAVANEDSPRIYSTTTGSLLHDFGPGRRGALAFSADGRSLAISRWNGPINIYDITVPNEIHHRLPGGRVTICPDTRHVFCSFGDESRLEIYDLVTGQCISERQPTKGHSVGLDAISPNERRASYHPAVAVVDLENPNGVMTLGPRHGAPVFLSDDLLAVQSTSDVKTYDLRTGEIVKQFPFPEEQVGEYGAILDAIPNGGRIGIAFHRDTPNSVFVLDTNDGTWRSVAHHYRNVRLSRDGRYVAAFDGDAGIQISDAETGAKLHEVLVPTRVVVSVDFSPDSRTLAGVCSDGTLRLWRVTTGQELCTLAKFAERPEYCRFSSDGSTLIASAGHGGENGEWDVFVFIAAPERENCEQQ
ncbi:MAG TPA: WD40 repeat domain-containing protein, partial [Lacipirellulaceae bacterium]|nr:WD40 repeat domain-containing protein [Lacipirellulaceae bacterium]